MLELNKIHHGDCLELMKDIPDGSIDMILCDLPYGTTSCKWDTIIPFEPLWTEYERVIKDNGAIVLTASQPFASALVMSNPKLFRYEWIWLKSRSSNSFLRKQQPLKFHENIMIFSKSKAHNQAKNKMNYVPQMQKREEKNKRTHPKPKTYNHSGVYGGNRVLTDVRTEKDADTMYPKSYQSFFNDSKTIHPTQKPVALFEYLIRTYTNEGELVLDNCIGSGTTAIASLNTGRSFIGIEKEKEYVDIANKRIQEHTA